MLINRELILAKVESVYNTDAAPTGAANAILVEAPNWGNEGARMIDRSALVKTTIGARQQLYGGALKTVSFAVEVKGSGAAGTAPELGVLLRGCGMAETVVGATSVTYDPASSGHESLTIWYYQDGMIHKLTGCRGTFTMSLEAGGVAKLNFTFTGHVGGEVDGALATPTYDSTVPPVLVSVPFSIGAYSAVISALEVDMGNEIVMPPDISASDGYGEIRITKRDVKGSFDPEMTLVATNDWLGDWRGGSALALDTGVIGGTAGNRFRVQHPQTHYRELSQADREGLRTLDVGYGAHESASGDDEISIAFT